MENVAFRYRPVTHVVRESSASVSQYASMVVVNVPKALLLWAFSVASLHWFLPEADAIPTSKGVL